MTAAGVAPACLLLCFAVAAQDEGGFASLFERAEALRAQKEAQQGAQKGGQEGSEPTAVREAYAAALAAFLRLPPGAELRKKRCVDGAFSAWQAKDVRQAPLLYAEAWSTSKHSQALAEQCLGALLDCGLHEAAIEFAKEIDGEFHEVASRVLSGDQRGGDQRLLEAADRMLKAGKLDLGLWAFEQAALGSPGVAFAWSNWGLALRNAGRTEDCEKAYRKALELAPNDSLVWNDLGLFLKGSDRLDAAAAAFEKGRQLENPPGSSPAILNLLRLEVRLQRKLVPDGDGAISAVLSLRPEAAFPRRIAIDRILERVKQKR